MSLPHGCNGVEPDRLLRKFHSRRLDQVRQVGLGQTVRRHVGLGSKTRARDHIEDCAVGTDYGVGGWFLAIGMAQ